MNTANKFKKNIWAIVCTIVLIITIIGIIYMHYSDQNNIQPVHHPKHSRIIVHHQYEQPSVHYFGFKRLRYYLLRPPLARKWNHDDTLAIAHYAKINNLAAWQDKFLIKRMLWYNAPIHTKYHVHFSFQLIKLLQGDYYKKNHRTIKTQSHNIKIANQIRWNIYNDINKFRRERHLKPYHIDNKLQQLANIRAKQTNQAYLTEPNRFEKEKAMGNDKNSDNWIHGKDNHQSDIDDIKRYHIYIKPVPNSAAHDGTLDENAGPIYIGRGLTSDFHYHRIENNNNIKAIAWNSVNDMVNHDHFAHNGHRKAILAPHHSSIGIGIFFNINSRHQQKGAVIEEFD